MRALVRVRVVGRERRREDWYTSVREETSSMIECNISFKTYATLRDPTMLRMAVRKGDASEVVAVHVLSASRSRCAMFVAKCSGVKMESFYSVFCKRPDL